MPAVLSSSSTARGSLRPSMQRRSLAKSGRLSLLHGRPIVSLPTVSSASADATTTLLNDLPEKTRNAIAPVMVEAGELKRRLAALQKEVTKYKALSDENDALVKKVKDLEAERDAAISMAEASAKSAAQLQERQAKVDEALVAQKREAEEAVQRLAREKEAVDKGLLEAKTIMEEMAQSNSQLVSALANSAQRLIEIVYPSHSLPDNLFVKAALLQGPLSEQVPVQTTPVAPAAGRPLGFFGWIARLVSVALYAAFSVVSMFYAATALLAKPPALTLEFCAGALFVAWLLPAASGSLLGRA